MTYKMTPARRAALKKAQAASARKRRGKGKGKLAKANRRAARSDRTALVAATGGLALAASGVAGAYYYRQQTKLGGPKTNYGAARKEARARINRRRTLRVSATRMRNAKPELMDVDFNRRQTAAYAIRTVFGRRR